VLQIWIIQEFFTLDGDYSRKLSRVAWIACLVIFIGFTIAVYWNTCYPQYIRHFLLLPFVLTTFCVARGLTANNEPERFRRNNNIIMYTHSSERNGNEVKSWMELI
jgi:hypothetical protein